MKAKNKSISRETLESLGLTDLTPSVRVKKVTEPAKREPGVILGSVDELIGKLKERGILE